MAQTRTIQAILDKLYAERLKNVGVGQVMIDGVMVRFENSEQRDKAISYWEGKLAVAKGERPLIFSGNLSGAFR